MEPIALAVYKMLSGGQVLNDFVDKVDFGGNVKIKAVSGTISSFPKLHVQLVLRTKPKDPEGGWIHQSTKEEGVIAALNCGNAGVGNLPLSGLDIEADALYFYCWAHNMNWRAKDFHGSYIIYYEE